MINFRNCVMLFMLISLWGCNNSNHSSVILDATGKHPAGWIDANIGGNHPASFLSAPEKCQECHGADLRGGVSNVGCFSTDRNGISCHAQGPFGHAAGWSNPIAHGVHAKAAAVGVNGMAFCTNCHGADYRGAGVSQKDCLRCHTTAPHPPKPWFGTPSTHSNTDTSNAPACAVCHTGGANLSAAGRANLPATAIIGSSGCFNNTLCHGVMGHSDAQWALPSHHGVAAKSDPGIGGNTGLAVCQQCHGADFSGGLSGQSCFPCHTVSAPHPKRADWTLLAGVLNHESAGAGNAVACATCHNATTSNLSAPYLTRFASSPSGSFKTGTPDCFSATMCHGDVRKTSNCDACHSTAATNPFKSMAGASAPSDAKVGAHVKHLNATLGKPVVCSECHFVPTSPAIAGTHRNGVNDIVFGTLAKTGGLVPTYTAATGICSNTYCHGASLNGGSNKNPRWNDTAYNVGCATCHGYPPATTRSGATHPATSTCSSCHPHVNATNNGFVNASLHIDGTVQASGGAAHAFPNPGSAHRTATPSACQGCHNIASPTGTYPVAAGTPPNCAGCHYRTLFVGCSDCHGASATNAWPNGTVFPNVAGQHSTHSAITGITCDVCHFGGGTGTSTHGNSNRILKTANNVVVVFSTAGGTMGATTSYNAGTNRLSVTCTGMCHEQHDARSW